MQRFLLKDVPIEFYAGVLIVGESRPTEIKLTPEYPPPHYRTVEA